MIDLKIPQILQNKKAQSAVELAIFGSILLFIISLIFRQGLSASNSMNTQLKATRYSMSKSLEGAVSEKPGRNAGATLVIEDRLSGDFTNKFGSRDRVPLIAGGGASFTNQLNYPIDDSDFDVRDLDVLPHYDVWINGQRFSFLTANYRLITLPLVQGTLATCGNPHPKDSRCWNEKCAGGAGCVVLQKIVQNFPDNNWVNADPNFDVNFGGTPPVDPSLRGDNPKDPTQGLQFMWQWQAFDAMGELSTRDAIDVDGDFHEEQIISSQIEPDSVDINGNPVLSLGRTWTVKVIDRQEGDLDFTVDGRRNDAQVGLTNNSDMFSETKKGTYYRIQEGKLFDSNTNQYIRNVNRSEQVDIVQRVLQLSHGARRFCNGAVVAPAGVANSIESCSNDCTNPASIGRTCFDTDSNELYVRSRISNRGGRSWLTRTEVTPP